MPPQVIFLRGVNVGGHRTFKPSELAKELAHLGAVNIGAAGTFVIRKTIAQAALKRELVQRLPFEPEMMVCSATELLGLTKSDPFAAYNSVDGVTPYVTILAQPIKTKLTLPITQPPGDQWQVQIIAVTGRFVLSLHRRAGKRLVYPNEVVEKHFKVEATTRNWNTIETICKTLRGS